MKHEYYWVIGCIAHDGSIVGRPYNGTGYGGHNPEESKGKRWRWHIHDEDFMFTLDSMRRADGLSAMAEMTDEEELLVVDWLIKNGYAKSEKYDDFVKYQKRKNTP